MIVLLRRGPSIGWTRGRFAFRQRDPVRYERGRRDKTSADPARELEVTTEE